MRKILAICIGTLMLGIGSPCFAAAPDGKLPVKGVVTDSKGEPVIGASVFEKGTANGTITDLDGSFLLTASDPSAVIRVSFIGFKDYEFPASAPAAVIVLQEDFEALEGVVVIGYGTVKKSDLTGSVSTVEADEINRGMISTPTDLLKGKSAGVVVTPGDGAPGSGATIRIRGGASLNATNDPLIIIDGLPVSNGGIDGMGDPLSAINPDDIASFSVLKDASATAIYGSRASNGVIVITTKKGSLTGSSLPSFNFDVKTSLSQVADYVDVLTADELRQTMKERYGEEGDAFKALGTADTDWQKEIYRLAPTVDVNGSLTGRISLGKAGDLPYRVSQGFLSQEGVLLSDRMDRGTFSLNLSPVLFDRHLTVSLNGKSMLSKYDFANRGAISQAVRMNPTHPVYDKENGIHGFFTHYAPNGSVNTMAVQNPIAMIKDRTDVSNSMRFIGNAQFDYKFHGFDDLRFNLNLGLDYAFSQGWNKVAAGSEQSFHNTAESGSGSMNRYDYTRSDKTLEAYLAYNKDFGKGHHFDAMAGYSWQQFHYSANSRTCRLDEDRSVLGDNHPAGELFLVSFFGRLNYSYGDRYLLTATLRQDGTSRFIHNKWGLFPSVALGWNLAKEAFLRDSDIVNNLKLRLSWGETGQQDVGGYYDSMPTYYRNLLGSQYAFGDRLYSPVTPLGYNADLKWETTTTYNIGMDFGFLHDRITAAVDLYRRKTADMINFVPVPALGNLTNYLNLNIGSMENKGVEFNVDAIAVDTKDWTWSVGGNVAWNRTEITKLTATPNDRTGVETGGISGGVGNNIQMHQVGFAPSAFYVYQQVYDAEGRPIEGEYVDRDANGILDNNDRYFYHKPAADVTLGVNTTLSYKRLTLAVSGHGAIGNWVYNNVASDGEMQADLWTNNFTSNRLHSSLWSGFHQACYLSDYYVRDGSFFKVDNLTLGYTFPNLLRQAVERPLALNLFFTLQNVCTFTEYDGLDPEIYGGIDNNLYPRPRTWILGVKLNF